MSQFYLPILVVHVLVAILGIGTIAAIAIVAGTAQRIERGPTLALNWLGPLLRYASVSLGLMLVTGILLGVAGGSTIHQAWWFRGSALLLLPIGALLGQARQAVRRGLASATEDGRALARVQQMAYIACGLVAVIAVLMEAKPF